MIQGKNCHIDLFHIFIKFKTIKINYPTARLQVSTLGKTCNYLQVLKLSRSHHCVFTDNLNEFSQKIEL